MSLRSIGAILEEKLNPHNPDYGFEDLIDTADNRDYKYDEEGNLISVRYWKGSLLLAIQSFEYDIEGNLTGETWSLG